MKRPPRSLLLLSMTVLAVGAFLAHRYLPMWRDTIFHSDEGGVVQLPSGVEVPTNRWLSLADKMDGAALLQIGDGKSHRHHLILNYDSSHKTLLVTDSGSTPLVITDHHDTNERTEFWVECE